MITRELLTSAVYASLLGTNKHYIMHQIHSIGWFCLKLRQQLQAGGFKLILRPTVTGVYYGEDQHFVWYDDRTMMAIYSSWTTRGLPTSLTASATGRLFNAELDQLP
jgi:hypothetical protein